MVPKNTVVNNVLESEIQKCAKCGKCRSICPVFIETGSESMVARGRISLAESLRSGEIFHTELLRDYLLSCKKCLRCSSICPSGVDYDLIIDHAQRCCKTHWDMVYTPGNIQIVFDPEMAV